ncbi:MAG: hypothetical protein J6Z41_05845 [Prevotella sp.]|nr:hypothetical protein [Prevotella sp.]
MKKRYIKPQMKKITADEVILTSESLPIFQQDDSVYVTQDDQVFSRENTIHDVWE